MFVYCFVASLQGVKNPMTLAAVYEYEIVWRFFTVLVDKISQFSSLLLVFVYCFVASLQEVKNPMTLTVVYECEKVWSLDH